MSTAQGAGARPGALAGRRRTGARAATSRSRVTLEDRLSAFAIVAVKGLKVFAVLFLLLPLVVAAHQAFLPTVAFEVVPTVGVSRRA